MKAYGCYFLNGSSRVRAYRQVVCANDEAAVAIARNLLKQNYYHGAELWHGERRVAEVQRGLEPTGESGMSPKVSQAIRSEASG